MKDQKAESMLRQNLLCRDTNSCNMEELVETKESIERRSSVATNVAHLSNWPGRNKGTQRCNTLQAEEISLCRDMDLNVEHKNKLNREKRGRDRLF